MRLRNYETCSYQGFSDVSKNLPANRSLGDMGYIPGSERYYGGRNGNPLQYSYPENSMD